MLMSTVLNVDDIIAICTEFMQYSSCSVLFGAT
jgi:hypothetical protein